MLLGVLWIRDDDCCGDGGGNLNDSSGIGLRIFPRRRKNPEKFVRGGEEITSRHFVGWRVISDENWGREKELIVEHWFERLISKLNLNDQNFNGLFIRIEPAFFGKIRSSNGITNFGRKMFRNRPFEKSVWSSWYHLRFLARHLRCAVECRLNKCPRLF